MKRERLGRLKREPRVSLSLNQYGKSWLSDGGDGGDGGSGESQTKGGDGSSGNQVDGLSSSASPAHDVEGKGSPLHVIDARLDVEMVCMKEKGEGGEEALEEKKASLTPREEWGEEEIEIEGDDGKGTSSLASVMTGAFLRAFAGEEVAVGAGGGGGGGGVVRQERGRGGATARPARKKGERGSDESMISSDNDDDNSFVGNDGDGGDDVSSFIINDSGDDGSDVESIMTPRDYATRHLHPIVVVSGDGGTSTAGGGKVGKKEDALLCQTTWDLRLGRAGWGGSPGGGSGAGSLRPPGGTTVSLGHGPKQLFIEEAAKRFEEMEAAMPTHKTGGWRGVKVHEPELRVGPASASKYKANTLYSPTSASASASNNGGSRGVNTGEERGRGERGGRLAPEAFVHTVGTLPLPEDNPVLGTMLRDTSNMIAMASIGGAIEALSPREDVSSAPPLRQPPPGGIPAHAIRSGEVPESDQDEGGKALVTETSGEAFI